MAAYNEEVVELVEEVHQGLDGESFIVKICKWHPNPNVASIAKNYDEKILPHNLQEAKYFISSLFKGSIWKASRIVDGSVFWNRFLKEEATEIKKMIPYMDPSEEKIFISSLWEEVKAVGSTEEKTKKQMFDIVFPGFLERI